MRLQFVLPITFLVAVAAYSQRPLFDVDRPAHDPCVMKELASMVRDAAGGMKRGAEVAGFLMAGGDGSVSLARWRSTAGVWGERFDGAIPAGVVAVVHTHPREWDRPSSADVREAMRIGLPFYVLSQLHVWVVNPASGEVVELARSGWRASAERGECPATTGRQFGADSVEGGLSRTWNVPAIVPNKIVSPAAKGVI